MNILHTIILGIVEGVTEFLPISSTAHMDIVRSLLSVEATPFVKSFEIIIQLGAIMAVVVIYFKKIFSSVKYFKQIVIAFIPTAIIGFILYKIIKTILLGNLMVEAITILLGGLIILYVEHLISNKKIVAIENKTIESLSVKEAICLGLAQSIAVIPGVSRSGAVIVAGCIMKLPADLITEFSFILAIPTMLAATCYDLFKSGFAFSASMWSSLALGFFVAFIVALFVVKWLINYIKTHSFAVFGWYRVVLGFILFLFLLLK